MTYYLKKYVTALASAKDYVAQLAADHVYAEEALIVPFPTLAIFNHETQSWSIDIKAWLYLPLEGKKLKSYLPPLPRLSSFFASKTDVSVSDEQKSNTAMAITDSQTQAEGGEEEEEMIDDEILQEYLQVDLGQPNENPGRLGLFFVSNSVKVVTKSIINGVEHLLQPSDESGFIEQQLELSDQEIQSLSKKIHPESDDRKFNYEIRVNESKTDVNYKGFKCTIYVLAHTGVSVISDIDDTIKISKVVFKPALLKHTFYSCFKPVEGMNDLYQKWSKQNCQFHYVSASPWQLYPALRSFLEKHNYPIGTMNLRKFSWSLRFLKPPETYKIDIITQIITSYPYRIYIFVGDSGELDPEIYSKLYTIFPDNIAHIFIRDICQTPECLSSCHERYKKAFENIPATCWTIFKDPKTIPTNLKQLIPM